MELERPSATPVSSTTDGRRCRWLRGGRRSRPLDRVVVRVDTVVVLRPAHDIMDRARHALHPPSHCRPPSVRCRTQPRASAPVSCSRTQRSETARTGAVEPVRRTTAFATPPEAQAQAAKMSRKLGVEALPSSQRMRRERRSLRREASLPVRLFEGISELEPGDDAELRDRAGLRQFTPSPWRDRWIERSRGADRRAARRGGGTARAACVCRVAPTGAGRAELGRHPRRARGRRRGS